MKSSLHAFHVSLMTGASFDVTAPTLDAATSRAVELALPDGLYVSDGERATQNDAFQARFGMVRTVRFVSEHGDVFEGLVISGMR